MQNPNLPPGSQPAQGGGQPPQKLTREQKRALAEQKKRMEQQRMRAMELEKLTNNFQHELETSVIDPPLMYRLACNRLKLMMKADHCAAAMFESYEELGGEICIIRQQSNLPPKPEKKEDKPQVKIKRVIVDGEVIETKKVIKQDKKDEPEELKYPLPKPLPKDPPKSGQLPDLDGQFIHPLKIPDQVRHSRQPLMIPDVSKFSEQSVVQFAQAFGIKSMLVLPVVVNEIVEGVLFIMTVNQPHGYSPHEMQYVQKAIEHLARSIETAPPVLPDKLKDRVINPMTKGQNVAKQIEYYSDFMDDIYDFMITELEALESEEAEELQLLQEEQAKSQNRLRKVWYQIGKALEFKERPQLGYLFNIALNELADQAVEYAESKKLHKPRGLTSFQEIMNKIVKRPKFLEDFLTEVPDEDAKDKKHLVVGNEVMTIETETGAEKEELEEMFEAIDKEITKAVRGGLLFSEGRRATLINDIEQSEMLVNFVAVTAANDFKQHIKAHMPEIHEDIDEPELLAELAHQGMREISLAVAQNIAENYLYELETFLEQPEEWQKERIEQLQMYIHYRIMANLVPTLRGDQPSLWGMMIQEKLKRRAAKAAKQRAVLVGRMVRGGNEDADEDEDWDDEDEDEDEDD